jgi:hypothetical protein
MHEGQSDKIAEVESETPLVPGFIKEFSREASQEERDALAGEIRERRRQRDAVRVEQGELGEGKEKLEQEFEELATTIEAYNDASFLGKIKDYFEYKKTKAEIVEKTTALTGVEYAISDKEEEIPQFAETRKMIDDFYAGERKKWAEAGYTPEDIAKEFTEERLSALSVEEYALLMQRFPGEMVAHITRQGVRDHANSIWHNAGEGAYLSNFTSILQSGRLHSSLGIALQEHSKEEAMAKFIKIDDAQSREAALANFEKKFIRDMVNGKETFADESSIHFAAETVMDGMYGAEKGNEIFVAYPSAYVASQLYYGGKRDLTEGGESEHNDKWVYTKDQQGIPLDAGLIFIPEDAQVDPINGSRYKIDENGNPVKNEALYDGLKQFVDSPDFEVIAGEIKDIGYELSWKIKSRSELEKEVSEDQNFDSPYFEKRRKQKQRLLELYQKIEAQTGISDERVLARVFNYSDITGLEYANQETEDWSRTRKKDFLIDRMVRDSGAGFVEAEDTVTSKEYWEKYFTDHPNEQPSKIVFYKGGDPSAALNDWRNNNGIKKKTSDPTFGFPERQIDGDHPVANQGKDRLSSLAMKVIDDRFPEQIEEVEASQE